MTAAVTPGREEMLALDERLARAQKESFDTGEHQSSIDFQDARTMIARLAAKPVDEGVLEALENIQMAQSRLRAAMMGDEPCKPCIDLAASYLEEATKAISTTREPKR
jgi:hypothetical protein